MDSVDVIDSITQAQSWLTNNWSIVLQYAVKFIAAITIWFLGSMLAKVVANTSHHLMKIREIEVTVAKFLSNILRYAILAITTLVALSQIGVQSASIVAIFGAAGLAVALALQGSLANLAAGVLLVFFRPFRVEEHVQFGAISGVVEQIDLFSTMLRTFDGKKIVIPNKKIVDDSIINHTRIPERRTDITISVSYSVDILQVKTLLMKLVNAESRILQTKGVIVELDAMAASSLDFLVRYWTKNEDTKAVYWDLLVKIKAALDLAGIEIPYPKMDVNLYKNS